MYVCVQDALPANAACCDAPDETLDCRTAIAAAETAYRRLYGNPQTGAAPSLFGTSPVDATDAGADLAANVPAADSDDEAVAALEAALSGLE